MAIKHYFNFLFSHTSFNTFFKLSQEFITASPFKSGIGSSCFERCVLNVFWSVPKSVLQKGHLKAIIPLQILPIAAIFAAYYIVRNASLERPMKVFAPLHFFCVAAFVEAGEFTFGHNRLSKPFVWSEVVVFLSVKSRVTFPKSYSIHLSLCAPLISVLKTK